MTPSDCLFCRIATGAVPADVVHSGPRVMAFRDINPQAPVHVLVVPKEHVASLDASDAGDPELLGELLGVAAELARAEGIASEGYRTVINTGEAGGQTVGHLHLHVLGGRAMGWPPG